MKLSNPFPQGNIQELLKQQELPPFYKVRQFSDERNLSDDQLVSILEAETNIHFSSIKVGEKIGITAGSRGIDRIALILRIICDKIHEAGGIPYIVPCMGSHGVNPAGREAILKGFGITESTMGAKFVNEENLTLVDITRTGLEVFADSFLMSCDKVIVINRVKPHTAFHDSVESGLQKMMAVGMGKQKGASICHTTGFHGMYERIVDISDVIIQTGRIFMGIALVENSQGKMSEIHAISGMDIQRVETTILERARTLMPSLPFERADILIVDEMGKDISGSGMDTNVIGRYPLGDIQGNFTADKLVVLSLTEASEGNAHGMGFADFIPFSFFKQIDFEQTYQNGLTNKTPNPAKIPLVMPDDECAIKAALLTCTSLGKDGLEIIRIKNTHEITEFFVTESLLGKEKKQIELNKDPRYFSFYNGLADNWWR